MQLLNLQLYINLHSKNIDSMKIIVIIECF